MQLVSRLPPLRLYAHFIAAGVAVALSAIDPHWAINEIDRQIGTSIWISGKYHVVEIGIVPGKLTLKSESSTLEVTYPIGDRLLSEFELAQYKVGSPFKCGPRWSTSHFRTKAHECGWACEPSSDDPDARPL